jgi:hypothetical protein
LAKFVTAQPCNYLKRFSIILPKQSLWARMSHLPISGLVAGRPDKHPSILSHLLPPYNPPKNRPIAKIENPGAPPEMVAVEAGEPPENKKSSDY